MADREITPRLGLVTLDIADVPFGYPERVEFAEVMKANLAILDQMTFSSGSSGSLVYQNQMVTQADSTFWVSVASGSDSNDGLTEDTAFQTIGRGVDAFPHIVRHIGTLKVKRGTYAETVRDGHMYGDNGLFTSKIVIEGQDFDSPVLASGPISGVLGTAPSSGSTWAVTSTPGWTINNLKGNLAKITTGAQSGTFYPVAANGTASIDIPNTATNLNGASFELMIPAAIVTRSPGLFASFLVGNGGAALAGNGLQPKRLRINSPSFYGIYTGAGFCNPLECVIRGQTFAGVQVTNINSQVTVSRCYVSSSAAGIGFNAGEIGSLFLGGSVVEGGAFGIQVGGTCLRLGANASGHIIIQNCSTAGIETRSGPLMGDTFAAQKIILRNNAIGARMQSNNHLLMQFWEVTNNTSHGIQMIPTQYTTGHNSLHMFACKIQNNGGDGIRMETSHNNLHFGSSGGAISGNTGVGVRIGGASSTSYPSGSFTNVFVDSLISMDTNGGGDFSIDGGLTSFTLASLRADGDKAITDPLTFNRISGG